jgi:hypothetical protein
MDEVERCPECGHELYDDWERSRHAIGKHNYRSWTTEDRRKKADEMHKRKARSARDR